MNSSDKGTIFFLVALIALAVVLVDDIAVRVAMALVPAMLLAQRAMAAEVGDDTDPGLGAADLNGDRRTDHEVREGIGELLTHFREFYTTCHLFGQQRISAIEARERAAVLEKKLNQLLARLTTRAKARAELG